MSTGAFSVVAKSAAERRQRSIRKTGALSVFSSLPIARTNYDVPAPQRDPTGGQKPDS
jgi:hypothetical protein